LQFLALDALASWGSDPKQPHWRHPELRRALASNDQTDELRRIRASVQDSAVKAKCVLSLSSPPSPSV
jgi:hypothetical protein